MSDEAPPPEGTTPIEPATTGAPASSTGSPDPGGPPSPDPDWKSRVKATLTRLREKAAQSEWGKKLQYQIQNFEPAAAAEWAGKAFSRRGSAVYGTAATIALCAYFLADLAALMVGKYIPEPPLARGGYRAGPSHRNRTLDEYGVVFSRNLFSSEGKIPGEEIPGTTTGAPLADLNAAPVKTTLPFNLVGTVILSNELQSLATIEDKTANQVYPVRVEDEIPSKAKIVKIEPRRVIFINTASNHKEYVELPEELQTSNPRVNLPSHAGKGGPAIEQQSSTQYSVSRSEVDKTLSNLNEVLTQARAVPNFENGQPAGYKLFQIVPGSIYDKLGLHNGDVIAGLDGSPVNDPGKAFEMLSDLKSKNHLELQIKRDGKQSTFSYDIR